MKATNTSERAVTITEPSKKVLAELKEYFNNGYVNLVGGKLVINEGDGIRTMKLTGYFDFQYFAHNLTVSQFDSEFENAIKWCVENNNTEETKQYFAVIKIKHYSGDVAKQQQVGDNLLYHAHNDHIRYHVATYMLAESISSRYDLAHIAANAKARLGRK